MYGVIDPDVLWSCTNCGACVQQCPVDIEHVDHIDNMRRYQVLVESNFPAELNNIFKGLERKGNPWNMNPRDRMKWAEGLDFEVKQVGVEVEDLDEVEWLFWVGCAGAYEDRAKKTTQAVAELLNMAGVSFAVLGDGETCTGDSARRSGNEIVFQQLAMQNVETFKEMKVKKVVSTCAHCFNTLKNEYAEFGVELEVVHHTQLLNRLVREKKLTPVAAADGAVGTKTITYHDPCFLGRHNQVYEAPRELLEIIPGATFTEMPRNKERSFCCGAGGARMWMEETIGSRINVNRTVEAVATGADQIATGCPFCRVMLSDGLTLKQSEGEAREEVEIVDVAQMLLAAVKRAPAPEEEAEVVAEAEAATAAAATDTESKSSESKDDAKAGTEAAAEVVEEKKLDEPDPAEQETSDQAAAAQNNVPADAEGDGSADESPLPEEPRNADARDKAADDDGGETLEQPEGEPGDRAGDSGVVEDESDAAEAGSAAPTGDADAKPADEVEEPEAKPEPGDTTDPDAESAPSAQPETESSPSEDEPAPAADEPVEEDARDEEAETLDDKAEAAEPEPGSISPDAPEGIVAVEDGADPEVESDDVAPLTDANPSGADLTATATEMASDDEPDAGEAKKTD